MDRMWIPVKRESGRQRICKGPEAGKGPRVQRMKKKVSVMRNRELGRLSRPSLWIQQNTARRLWLEKGQDPGLAPRCLRVIFHRVRICSHCVTLGKSCSSLSLCPPLDNGQPNPFNARTTCMHLVTSGYTEPPVSASHIAYLFGGVLVLSSGWVVARSASIASGLCNMAVSQLVPCPVVSRGLDSSQTEHLRHSVPSPNICFLT